jgi:hypothetical protein
LALEVHEQTQRLKRSRAYLATPMALRLGGRISALYSTERQRKFYHKHHPLWGGITNMNLNTLWPSDSPGRATDYWRAVSTGPVTPLVLSVTTFDEHLTIGMSYRTTLLSPDEARRFDEALAQHIQQVDAHR